MNIELGFQKKSDKWNNDIPDHVTFIINFLIKHVLQNMKKELNVWPIGSINHL